MDKTELVKNVATIFRLNGHNVEIDVEINHRRIDVVAEEIQGIFRKTYLIECAEYRDSVGVDKAQVDINKLNAAKEKLANTCICAHVSVSGYSPQASGYLRDAGVSFSTYSNLISSMINFTPYIQSVNNDKLKPILLKEFQETRMYHDDDSKINSRPSIQFVEEWLRNDGVKWITILGDYGVGKSWLLKRILYLLSDRYDKDPEVEPLPFFIPLQNFAKAFDYQNLITRTLSRSGLSGVHYDAFQFLAEQGRIIFLLDSFDEMAQKLSRSIIRENLLAILDGVSGNSRVIMTSRPNYFENRAERIKMIDWVGGRPSHKIDTNVFEQQRRTAAIIMEKLTRTDFARLTDLSSEQCMRLFRIALNDNQNALTTLLSLFNKFQNLGSIAQRAVIARLLVTVAETLSGGSDNEEVMGMIPDGINSINCGKIFEIVVYNLIHRDMGVGDIPPSMRLGFLQNLATFLQSKLASQAASPSEVRRVVALTMSDVLKGSDNVADLEEEYYRVCRRHAGLTTLGQFEDTSGQIDLPVDAEDVDSPILFSHNSLREYLVAYSIRSWLLSDGACDLSHVSITDEICSFIWDIVEFTPGLDASLKERYISEKHKNNEVLFKVIYYKASKNKNYVKFFGVPANIKNVDLGDMSFSGFNLEGAKITGCLCENTNFRESNLSHVDFSGTDIDGGMFDNAKLSGADFRCSHLHSIYVMDKFGIGTTGILQNKEARQWLFTRGALVHPDNDLNPLLGQPWYEAAREVAATILKLPSGTHQAASLAKGTEVSLRRYANDFVEHLMRRGVLEKVVRSENSSGWVVKLNRVHINLIKDFFEDGRIDPILSEFFKNQQK